MVVEGTHSELQQLQQQKENKEDRGLQEISEGTPR
jgi:hypothetical protein